MEPLPPSLMKTNKKTELIRLTGRWQESGPQKRRSPSMCVWLLSEAAAGFCLLQKAFPVFDAHKQNAKK